MRGDLPALGALHDEVAELRTLLQERSRAGGGSPGEVDAADVAAELAALRDEVASLRRRIPLRARGQV